MYKIVRIVNILSLLVFPVMCLFGQAQIELNIPSGSHSQYLLTMKEGTQIDTVTIGQLDDNGKANFRLPAKYALYRGVANLAIADNRQNINIIISSNEKVTVKQDSLTNELVATSPENDYLAKSIARQSKIIENYNQLFAGDKSLLNFSIPEFRFFALQDEYKAFWTEISASPLYAARMVELLNCLSGIGFELNIPSDSVVSSQHRYLTQKADFSDLYHSGFWQLAMDVWYSTALNDDSLLVRSSRAMLDRTHDMFTRRELTKSLILEFIRYGKDNLLPNIGSQYLNIPVNGQEAPAIVAGDTAFVPRLSLILFYETGCGNCHNELHQLKEKYSLLSDEPNNIRIITISADADIDVNAETASTFPWKDNICNLKGFDDDNFRNYGVIGTPTYILVDKDGIIRGRYAKLKEFLK